MFPTTVEKIQPPSLIKTQKIISAITLKSLSFIFYGSIIIKNNAKEQYYERAF